jgi:uncharacterized protein (DUF2461 family)
MLLSIRQEIDYNFEEFNKIVSNKKCLSLFGELKGDKLSRPPKGYDIENPAVDYLKHKGFIWVQNFKVKELYEPNFQNSIVESFKEMKPLNNFINRTIIN